MQGTSCLSGLNHGNSGNIDDLVGLGLIDERIVNRPGAGHSSNLGSNNNYQVSYDWSADGNTHLRLVS